MSAGLTGGRLDLHGRCWQAETPVPFGFTHNLARQDCFDFAALIALAHRYDAWPEDCFVAAGAGSPQAAFYSVAHGQMSPGQALERLDETPLRVLLKRPERHDARFRELLDTLSRQVLEHGASERIVRCESTILVSSAAATTPFHFDPEIAFFSQIEGNKEYHVYEPSVLSETELERFYVCDMLDIGQVELAGRNPRREHVFELVPGTGLHQPQDAPHWVVTRGTRSVSYTFVLETAEGRARGRARSANHYLRRLGFVPPPPGAHPALDRATAAAMRVLLPLRRGLRRAI